MAEVRGEPRLVEEHRDELGVGLDVGADLLDDNLLLEAADPDELAQVDLGHATHAETTNDGVLTQLLHACSAITNAPQSPVLCVRRFFVDVRVRILVVIFYFASPR